MKKSISLLLVLVMLCSCIAMSGCNSSESSNNESSAAQTDEKSSKAAGLYVHALIDSDDDEAWHLWQCIHDDEMEELNQTEKYFFLPSSADDKKVNIYNAYSEAVELDGTTIEAQSSATVEYSTDKEYSVEADGKTYTLKFMKSNAEAAIYINNMDADGNGTDLMTYLNSEDNKDKSRTATATGAIVTPDGKIDNTPIKKIKGRGNTTWDKTKKSYNLTYENDISIAGMSEGSKYSILANYQDDSLSRNRFLYDLSDAVDMPYASDSRYVDFYVNNYYWGSYQICEKVETGSDDLVSDVTKDCHLNDDGTVKSDFPFLCEVDPGAQYPDDFFVQTYAGKVSIKGPELAVGDVGYQEVAQYVEGKFDEFFEAVENNSPNLSELADIESLTKLYLINELGKNWDAGVSSVFFTYKQDENGNYKFYGSPVWDYDNSLGNAVGVERDLSYMGVEDYEEYTGWWCKFKGKGKDSENSDNIINRLAYHSDIIESAPKIWVNEFMPAINHFTGEKTDENIGKELYTRDEYLSLIKDSAEMNYTSGWLLDTSENWIADHSSLTKASFDESTKKMVLESSESKYGDNFTDMYNYCADWLVSRSAWLSEQFS